MQGINNISKGAIIKIWDYCNVESKGFITNVRGFLTKVRDLY